MYNKEKKRQYVYDALVVLGMLALLTFICRLWPILLLVILGIFAAVIRLLFLSSKKVETLIISSIPEEPKQSPTEYDVRCLAYSVILRRITELVTGRHPDARWVWESPNALQHIELGGEVYILLNRAGGYRRAKIIIQNLQVVGFEFQRLALPGHVMEENTVPRPVQECEKEPEKKHENYELLAFEWVEANIIHLNERCNEAIGNKQNELILMAELLPVKESWKEICKELSRAGLQNVSCIPNGIKISLTQ